MVHSNWRSRGEKQRLKHELGEGIKFKIMNHFGCHVRDISKKLSFGFFRTSFNSPNTNYLIKHVTCLDSTFLKPTKTYTYEITLVFLFLCLCACPQLLSGARLFGTPWTVVHQAPLSMGILQEEYWSGLPCSHPWYLSDPGIKPTSLMSPALADGFLTSNAIWEAIISILVTPTY